MCIIKSLLCHYISYSSNVLWLNIIVSFMNYTKAEPEITIWNWSAIPSKLEHCNRLSMVSSLEMYSKYGLANWICSAKWGNLVGKWPMADCYFKLCKSTEIFITNNSLQHSNLKCRAWQLHNHEIMNHGSFWPWKFGATR